MHMPLLFHLTHEDQGTQRMSRLCKLRALQDQKTCNQPLDTHVPYIHINKVNKCRQARTVLHNMGACPGFDKEERERTI